KALSPEGYYFFHGTVTPDSKFVVVRGPENRMYLYPLEGGEPTGLTGLTSEHLPMRFSPDGRTLFFMTRGEVPAKIYRYDVASGSKELWKDLVPADRAGLNAIARAVVTADGRTYA